MLPTSAVSMKRRAKEQTVAIALITLGVQVSMKRRVKGLLGELPHRHRLPYVSMKRRVKDSKVQLDYLPFNFRRFNEKRGEGHDSFFFFGPYQISTPPPLMIVSMKRGVGLKAAKISLAY